MGKEKYFLKKVRVICLKTTAHILTLRKNPHPAKRGPGMLAIIFILIVPNVPANNTTRNRSKKYDHRNGENKMITIWRQCDCLGKTKDTTVVLGSVVTVARYRQTFRKSIVFLCGSNNHLDLLTEQKSQGTSGEGSSRGS